MIFLHEQINYTVLLTTWGFFFINSQIYALVAFHTLNTKFCPGHVSQLNPLPPALGILKESTYGMVLENLDLFITGSMS